MSVQIPTLEELEKLSCYEILGIELGASQKAVKKAYRRRALDVHPDKCDSPDAEELFAKVFEAYETLADESKRKDYDAKLRIQKERRAREDALDEGRRRMRKHLRDREEEAKHGVAKQSVQNEAKIRMKEEIRRLRHEMWLQANQKASPVPTSSAPAPDDHLNRTVRVRFTTVKENEEDLRLIFEPYGKIEDIIIGKDTALVSFDSSSAAADAVADRELDIDFGLRVSFSKALSSATNSMSSNAWNSFRPEGISHQEYETLVLKRLRTADEAAA